jgi:hypothetical protein
MLLTDTMRNDTLECSGGTLPHVSLRLQQPPSSSSSNSRSSFRVHQTVLLAPAAASQAPDTLTAVCSVLYPRANAAITYDMETQRAKRLLAGHTREVTEIAAAPAAWFGAQHVFATASRSGNVKICDARSSGSAAITLAGADYGHLEAVTLVSNNVSNNSSSSSSSSQLGAGMYCFAGGTGQSVWAWDLRVVRGRLCMS